MNKIYVTWREVEAMVNYLANQIKQSGRVYHSIYPIPRGGLIIGTMLSHQLGIPIELDQNNIWHRTLIVDDIADSGDTLDRFQFYLTKDSEAITLHYKPKSIVKPNYFAKTVANEDWIVYPWEKRDAPTLQDYKA